LGERVEQVNCSPEAVQSYFGRRKFRRYVYVMMREHIKGKEFQVEKARVAPHF